MQASGLSSGHGLGVSHAARLPQYSCQPFAPCRSQWRLTSGAAKHVSVGLNKVTSLPSFRKSQAPACLAGAVEVDQESWDKFGGPVFFPASPCEILAFCLASGLLLLFLPQPSPGSSFVPLYQLLSTNLLKLHISVNFFLSASLRHLHLHFSLSTCLFHIHLYQVLSLSLISINLSLSQPGLSTSLTQSLSSTSFHQLAL